MARIFPWWMGEEGGGGASERKCPLIVDRLGRTSEYYIEVKQMGAGVGLEPLATPLQAIVEHVFRN